MKSLAQRNTSGKPSPKRSVVVKCSSCAKEWERPQSQVSPRNFCSNACRFAYDRVSDPAWDTRSKPKTTFICETCGKLRSLTACRLKQRTGRYCSRQCAALLTRKPASYTEIVCGFCGAKKRIRKTAVRDFNYCTRACASANRRKQQAKWRNEEYVREYHREYRDKNRGRLNAQQRCRNKSTQKEMKLAHSRNRRAAKASTGKVTQHEWLALKKAFLFRCVCCDEGKPLTFDHIVPLSSGGEHSIQNAQPLCQTCNSSKHTVAIDYRPMFMRRFNLDRIPTIALYGPIHITTKANLNEI